jgi:hypothetical protein
MTSLQLSHLSQMHAGLASPASVCVRIYGCQDSLEFGVRTNELNQVTSDYRPEITRKGNGMT